MLGVGLEDGLRLCASPQACFPPSCLPDTRADLGPPCAPQARPAIEEQCRVLQSSAFAPCHPLVPPGLFLQTCVYDMCKYEGMRATLCAVLQAYADACQAEGVALQWRNSTFCRKRPGGGGGGAASGQGAAPDSGLWASAASNLLLPSLSIAALPCPPNSHYAPCAPPCPATCEDLYADALCEKAPGGCLEGCVCDRDHVLSHDQCVPLSACGCRDKEGHYHKVTAGWQGHAPPRHAPGSLAHPWVWRGESGGGGVCLEVGIPAGRGGSLSPGPNLSCRASWILGWGRSKVLGGGGVRKCC